MKQPAALNLLDLEPLVSRIDELYALVAEADKRVASAIQATKVQAEREQEVRSIAAQIKRIDRVLRSSRHNELEKLAPRSRRVDALVEFADQVLGAITRASVELEEIDAPALPGDADLKELQQALGKVRRKAISGTASAALELSRVRRKIDKARDTWKNHVHRCETDYRRWAEGQGGDRTRLTAARKTLLEDLESAESALMTAHSEARCLAELEASRDALLDELRSLGHDRPTRSMGFRITRR